MKTMKIASFLMAALLGGAATAGTIRVDVPDNIGPPVSTVTRAEVLADLYLWRAAGLDEFNGESQDIESHRYQVAKAKYDYLRFSSEYPRLVQELTRDPATRVVWGKKSGRAFQ